MLAPSKTRELLVKCIMKGNKLNWIGEYLETGVIHINSIANLIVKLVVLDKMKMSCIVR